MEKLTRAQLGCINALMAKLKLELEQQKESITASYSEGRITSRADLWKSEAALLIKWLKSQDPDEVAAEKMRRKIISMAHEMAWRIPGTKKADMKRIDAWCCHYGYRHKKLNSYTLKELPDLVTQFTAVYQSFLKGL